MAAPHPSSPPDAGSDGSQSSGMKAQAQSLADDAKQSAEAFADKRKAEGADKLHSVAGTAERIAEDVAEESPAAAEWVRKAAHGIDDVSRNLKDRSVGELLEMAKSFARREPAAFLAASGVAGFALARLLKMSAANPEPLAGTRPWTAQTAEKPTPSATEVAPTPRGTPSTGPGEPIKPTATPTVPGGTSTSGLTSPIGGPTSPVGGPTSPAEPLRPLSGSGAAPSAASASRPAERKEGTSL